MDVFVRVLPRWCSRCRGSSSPKCSGAFRNLESLGRKGSTAHAVLLAEELALKVLDGYSAEISWGLLKTAWLILSSVPCCTECFPFQIILKQFVIFWSGELFEGLTIAHENFVLDMANGQPKWGPKHPNKYNLNLISIVLSQKKAPQNSQKVLFVFQCTFFWTSTESRIVMD